MEEIEQLRHRFASAKARLHGAAEIDQQVELTLEKFNVQRYVQVSRVVVEAHVFKQTRRGRPGPDMAYRKITKRRFGLNHRIVQEAIDYDRKSNGMYLLLTNDRGLDAAQVLHAHKDQRMIEKRFEPLDTVHEIAPVLLENEARIEALFTLYAIALLVQALLERELRRAMHREHVGELPLYPEQRECVHPTTEQVLRLFSLAQRHELIRDGQVIQRFETELTGLQHQVLQLLGVPMSNYVRSARPQ